MKHPAHNTKNALALCAGPLLLAMATSAMTSDSYDMEGSETEIYITPAPVAEVPVESSTTSETPAPFAEEATAAPTVYYMETTSGGEMEKVPTSSATNSTAGEEEEAAPMENPDDGAGASCTNYDEDVSSGVFFSLLLFVVTLCAHRPSTPPSLSLS